MVAALRAAALAVALGIALVAASVAAWGQALIFASAFAVKEVGVLMPVVQAYRSCTAKHHSAGVG